MKYVFHSIKGLEDKLFAIFVGNLKLIHENWDFKRR